MDINAGNSISSRVCVLDKLLSKVDRYIMDNGNPSEYLCGRSQFPMCGLRYIGQRCGPDRASETFFTTPHGDLFCEKVCANCRLVLIRELLIDILIHQRSLPDTAVTKDDDFQQNLLGPTGRHVVAGAPAARKQNTLFLNQTGYGLWLYFLLCHNTTLPRSRRNDSEICGIRENKILNVLPNSRNQFVHVW